MRFRVLGPIEAEAGGRLLDIGPRQRRMVLAALAVDAGTPVSVKVLAERVWGAGAPGAPRSSIYAHITRLRQVLDHAGDAHGVPVSLCRHNAGYVLNVDPQCVDLHRFRMLVEASRVREEKGDRMAMLREAMDLWRGPPVSGSDGDWAVRLRRRFESQFIGATTVWAEEELRLGRPDLVVERLATVVAEYPLAVPAVALLMRALCATGRTAEALQRYAETRTRLAEQLGAEPGPELSRLHVAILRGEYDVAPAWVGSGGGAFPVPQQLPADLVRFTGRHAELCDLERWLAAARPAVTVVHGPVGVGTSALAVHAAHRAADQYPDGQLYVDLRGSDAAPLPTEVALARLLRALGVGVPSDVEEAAVLFRSVVADRRLLVVLDNAAAVAQVRPLLPGNGGCATLVTGCRGLVGLGDASVVRLEPLADPEAADLLRQRVGAARVAAEPAAARAIVTGCDGLPLALCAAGARLAARPGWPLRELARRLAEPAGRLDALEFEGIGVRASLATAVRRLGDHAAADAFAVLGAAFATGFTGGAAADLLGWPVPAAERMLDRLVDVELLENPTPGAYRMRELPRGYARERFAVYRLGGVLPRAARRHQADDG